MPIIYVLIKSIGGVAKVQVPPFRSGSILHLPYQSAVLHLCTLRDTAAEGLACHHGDGRDLLKVEPFAIEN